MYFAPQGEGEKRRGPMPLGLFTPPSGRGLVISVFYPAVRTGSSNNRFFTPPLGQGLVIPVFFGWSLAPDLRSVKTILAAYLRSCSVYLKN